MSAERRLHQPDTLAELRTLYRQAIDYDNEAGTAACRRARERAQDRYAALLLPTLRGARLTRITEDPHGNQAFDDKYPAGGARRDAAGCAPAVPVTGRVRPVSA